MQLQFTETKDIFSSNHIDSNELNIPFYLELLHILGVEEITKSGKTIIQRKANNRDIGSFLELTMHEIALQKKTLNLDKTVYGHTQEEQIFHAALELSITWVNRILFLKLLESQLINFNSSPPTPEGGAKNSPAGGKGADYAFLNLQILPNFSEVFILFHKVLAIKEHERETNLQEKYKFVPYLNSSLFEISELEQQFININALGNGNMLTVISSTVLQNHAKKLTTLDYFLRFLNSYNFSSEGKKQEVSQDNDPVINAAILGKIFEKINGYKDGAVFTPASITMYMCRRSIRMAVVQKFNEIKQWNCVSFEELKEKIEDKREANVIINTLKICDPAVGSGHFLVSALNEIIGIKSELGALFDRNGGRIRDYDIRVVEDELEIKDVYTGKFFVYRKLALVNEIQLLQEALFHEKQTIIENCLFGVDINPNSVKICRLRLWIELLKNAYYISPTPNPSPQGGGRTPSPAG